MKPINLSELKPLMHQLDLHPEKTMGQNFLIDKNIRNIIYQTANLSESDKVLEIGTGLGSLTDGIAQKAALIITIEKDKRLWNFLKDKYQNFDNIELLCDD